MILKKWMIGCLLIACSQMAVQNAKASDPGTALATLASYLATSSGIVAYCLATDQHSVSECLFMGTVVTAITLDAYDKQIVQQAAEDAASLLATKGEPSEFLNLVFEKMREEMGQQGSAASHEELAYAVLLTADEALKK